MLMKRKALLVTLLVLLLHLSVKGQEKLVNIVFIGNSITHGATLAHPKTEAPPVSAVHWLNRQPGIKSVQFSNQGVNGYTTVDFLPVTATTFPKVTAAADSFKGQDAILIFSIMLGTNDSAIDGPNGSPLSSAQYRQNLSAIVDRLLFLYPACKIVVQRPIWYSPNTCNASQYLQEGLTRLQSYFPEIPRLVSTYADSHAGQVWAGDTTAYQYFKAHPKLYTPEKGRYGTFYLHPKKQGAQKLGILWGKAIYTALLRAKALPAIEPKKNSL